MPPSLVAAVLSFGLAGCRVAPVTSSAALAEQAIPASSRPHTDLLSVQQSADYQQAVQLYARRDYRAALAALDRLLAAQGRTGTDRAFLQRQRSLCRAALNGGRPDQRPSTTDHRRPIILSPERADCGPRALLLLCQKRGIPASLQQLRHLAGTSGSGTTLEGLQRAAEAKGFHAEGLHLDRDALAHLDTPALAWIDGDHYLAVLSVEGEQATIHDPNRPNEEPISLDDLLRRSGGLFLTLR